MTAAADTEIHLLPPLNDPARRWALALMALFPLFYGALAIYLGADASWDLRNYHWYNAWAYLTGHRHVDLMPSQGQFFLNPWLDVPFYVLATHLPLKAAYFILAAVQGLNYALLFMISYATLAISKTSQKTPACALLAALGMLGAMDIAEVGTVFYDNITSLGIFLSALLLLRRLDFMQTAPAKKALGYATLCGIPGGFVVGLKMTCASYCVGLCLALLIFTPQMKRCFLLAFCFGLGVLAGFAAAYGHWGWYLYTQFGSPTFPLFNIIFRSPLLPNDSLLLDYAPPHNWKLLIFPFLFAFDTSLVNEIAWQDLRIPVLYALFLWLILQYKLFKKTPAAGTSLSVTGPARFLLVAGAVSYYCWLLSETVYRYLLPLDMLAPLLIVICIGMLPLQRKARGIAAAVVLAALAVTIQPGDWGRRDRWPEKIASITPHGFKDASDTMILMAGADPYAFLLPEFPPQLRFVRIMSRGFPPDADYGINKLMRAQIDAHKGPLMLFMPHGYLSMGEVSLQEYGLTLLPNTCRSIHDRLYEERLDKPYEMRNDYPWTYSLCDVQR
ncbi:MAG: hypothetical protein ACAH83_09335 [Alphaproteobacteria bacterium]